MCITGKKQKKSEQFENTDFDANKINKNPKYDLVKIYEKCIEEMTLQQSKRDQIITVFMAMFSFVVSYVLSSEKLDFAVKGFVFLAMAIIGFGFSLIIIRYRIYKEAYWICCQTLTNLMNFKEGEFDKATIQGVYYTCLKKRGQSYVLSKGENKRFDNWKFFRKNIFSSETIYCLIHAFIVSILFGLSIFLVTYALPCNSLFAGGISGIVALVIQVFLYFKNLIEIYSVLVDGTNASFNKAFSKAWFLHLYVE